MWKGVGISKTRGEFRLQRQYVQRHGVFSVLKVVYCGWFEIERVKEIKNGGGGETEEDGEVNKGWILASREFGVHPVSNGKPLGGFKQWRGGVEELRGWIKETDYSRSKPGGKNSSYRKPGES